MDPIIVIASVIGVGVIVWVNVYEYKYLAKLSPEERREYDAEMAEWLRTW